MKKLSESRILWILTLCIGICPFVFPFLLCAYRMHIEHWRWTDFLVLYSFVYWFTYLIGFLLIVLSSAMLIRGKYRKNQKPLPYWNHNTAYWRWIVKRLGNCQMILDVGCGDGALAAYLDDGTREITAIDPAEKCIRKAQARYANQNGASYQCISFADFSAESGTFNAVIFAASLHHMDTPDAVRKAKELLAEGGILLIVGLAKPLTVSDWIIEILRVVPSALISRIRRMESTESHGIPTAQPEVSVRDIRRLMQTELPGGKLRRALHYRYLFFWKKIS